MSLCAYDAQLDMSSNVDIKRPKGIVHMSRARADIFKNNRLCEDSYNFYQQSTTELDKKYSMYFQFDHIMIDKTFTTITDNIQTWDKYGPIDIDFLRKYGLRNEITRQCEPYYDVFPHPDIIDTSLAFLTCEFNYAYNDIMERKQTIGEKTSFIHLIALFAWFTSFLHDLHPFKPNNQDIV